MERWSEAEIAYVLELVEKKKAKEIKVSWVEITEIFNRKFNMDRGFESIRKCYNRYQNYFKQSDNHVRTLKQIHRTKKSNSYNSKENRAILDEWNKRDDLLETIENTVKKISLTKYKLPSKKKKSRKKKSMTMELLFSDIHYGKFIDNVEGNFVNLEEIRKRVRTISSTILEEISRESKSFNVDRLIIAMIGDIIENADFHGVESHKACEFGTSRQVQEAINSMFFDLILPLGKTGIQIDVPCVTGNHDRMGKDKTYQKPGEENLTYIIYRTLELLCNQSGLKNVTFDICKSIYLPVKVYDNIIVYEHGDELKNLNRDTMANLMAKRQVQLGHIVDFYRIGHYHEPVSYGQGRMQVNGSVPGQDDYADSKGFCSEAVQILNYYIETTRRSTCFFRSFPIYLQKKE